MPPGEQVLEPWNWRDLHWPCHVLLRHADPQHPYRCCLASHATEAGLVAAGFHKPENSSFLRFPRWYLVNSPSSPLEHHTISNVSNRTLIFDIIRLVAMIQFTHSGPDITCACPPPLWYAYFCTEVLTTKDNQVPFVVWTCIEAAVGITAACLSNLRPLFRLGQRDFWSQARQSTGHSKEELNKSQDLSLEGSSIGYVQGGIYTRHSVSIQHEEAWGNRISVLTRFFIYLLLYDELVW